MYTIEIYPEKELNVITFDGVVDFDQVRKSIEDLVAHPDFRPEFRGVVDHRRSTIRMSPKEVREVAGFVKVPDATHGRWAMLVDTPQATALAGIYVSEIESQHEETLFSTVAEAARYLKIDLEGIVSPGTND